VGKPEGKRPLERTIHSSCLSCPSVSEEHLIGLSMYLCLSVRLSHFSYWSRQLQEYELLLEHVQPLEHIAQY
jgi:hypothetical protein